MTADIPFVSAAAMGRWMPEPPPAHREIEQLGLFACATGVPRRKSCDAIRTRGMRPGQRCWLLSLDPKRVRGSSDGGRRATRTVPRLCRAVSGAEQPHPPRAQSHRRRVPRRVRAQPWDAVGSTGLTEAAWREHGRLVLSPFWPLAAEVGRSQTPEQRATQRGLPPAPRDTSRSAPQGGAASSSTEAAAARNHALFLAGAWKPPRPRDPGAPGRASQRCRRELVQDPAYRAWLSRRLSEGHGGRLPVTCAACRTVFELPRARALARARQALVSRPWRNAI